MFSPATRRTPLAAYRRQTLGGGGAASPTGSPSTPLDDRRLLVPDRPATGTPAPWAPRLSVVARLSPVKNSEKGLDADQIQPVFVGEVPQAVRNAQDNLLQKSATGDMVLVGGMDKEVIVRLISNHGEIGALAATSSRRIDEVVHTRRRERTCLTSLGSVCMDELLLSKCQPYTFGGLLEECRRSR